MSITESTKSHINLITLQAKLRGLKAAHQHIVNNSINEIERFKDHPDLREIYEHQLLKSEAIVKLIEENF